MWCIHSYPSGLLRWHWGNHMIAPVPVKQLWRICYLGYQSIWDTLASKSNLGFLVKKTHLDGCIVAKALCFAKACTPRDIRYWKKKWEVKNHRVNYLSKQKSEFISFLFSLQNISITLVSTRTIRTPAFPEYPPLPHDYSYYGFISDPHSKQDKVKVTNSIILPKFKILEFGKKALHTTHILNLLDRMCKCEMDPASIMEVTEWTLHVFCPQTDGQTTWNQYPPFNFVETEGIIMSITQCVLCQDMTWKYTHCLAIGSFWTNSDQILFKA